MKKKKTLTVKVYTEPIIFCNRENESKFIQKRIKKNKNVVIISPNGNGKTSLINYSLNQLKVENNYNAILIDLIVFATFRKFLISYIESLLRQILLPPNGLVLDTSDDIAHLSEIDLLKKLNHIFSRINDEKTRIIIVFDNIHYSYHYGTEKFENSILNPIIHSKNILFILAGTKKIYTLEKTDELYLKKLDINKYQNLVKTILSRKGIKISNKALAEVVEWSGGEILIMDAIFNRILNTDSSKIRVKETHNIIDQIIVEASGRFEIVKELLSQYQWKLLLAIALQDSDYQITSSSFIGFHELNAPSSVKTALDALMDKELILKNGRKYELTNRLLKNWIVHNIQKNSRS